MENLTIGQIAVALAFIVAFFSGLSSIKQFLRKGIEEALKAKFESLEKSQREIIEKLNKVDTENCKNYLITFLSEISRGEQKDEIEIKRFWEEYEHYIICGGNSYIKRKVDDLQKKGVI